ncbi:integrase [Cupriavidus sp. TA19]|uniref:phage integrase Arm DNA-binding domain-containing protein n=1 Tax=unclassified Cupriavidus TaxID=2640874 RepID=UPI00272949AF|nr:phage integrase Arm DNA-binding domain-containing protein [Cupriavidus sp. TA19]GLC92358.1 integrase [Cupriavidus sp. TA19]
MAARPRIRKRAHFPPNLHEARPGYFTWRDPRDGKTHVIGRVPTAQAIHEALEANLVVERGTTEPTLAARVAASRETVAQLIEKMPTEGVKHATVIARNGFDRVIRNAIGHIECAALTTKDIADMLEAIKEKGALAYAKKIRTRITTICTKGIALGWMERNPAAVTEKVKVKVMRRRMTLSEFNAILAKAPEVADWLPNAMLLALVSGQDRSTVARWERSFVKGDVAVLQRSKTEVRIAIPTALRMDAVGMSLADVIARCKSTGVVSKYLIHHVRSIGRTKRGDPVRLSTISISFAEARELAGIHGEDAPTFHEIRSLCKRLYMEQGGIDTKALLGHMSDAIADLYANNRGLEPIKVSINAA